MGTTDRTHEGTCANCGAALTGAFCTQCGQSAETLQRPALALLRDIMDGLTAWDGRLLTTLRRLYGRPGAVTRDFLDGRRARHTPPFRLYVIAVLVFITLFSVAGVTVLGVHVEQSPNTTSQTDAFAGAGVGDLDVSLRLFRPRWEAPPEPVHVEALLAAVEQDRGEPAPDLDTALAEMDEAGRRVVSLAVRILENPVAIERQLALALSQAALFMVIGFAVLNLCLHPRAAVVTHAIHSLYLHAALFPFIAITTLAGLFAGLALESLSYMISAAASLVMLAYVLIADRRVYGSSWLGAALRLPALVLGYFFTFLAVAITLVFNAVF
jgi:hypothetical protein